MNYWILWNLGISDHNEELYKIDSIQVFNVEDLVDDYNEPEQVAGRLLQILNAIRMKDKRIVIMCAAGISRSNALAMGILCINNNLDWDDAYRIVKACNPKTDPNEGISLAVVQAIDLIKRYCDV